MGPKKKGKGSKLARMSEEERMRYLQHRAAIEEEARRRKEQLIATFMKNKLKREEAFSRLNMAKINQQWRQTLRGIKCAELKQDLEALYKWFDHTATKKTKLIECLLEDLKEAECQYSRIHQCHMETIDRLLLLYNQRINHLHKQYEEDRDQVYKIATGDAEGIVKAATLDQENLKSIIFRMQESFSEATTGTKSQHLLRTDELRNNMLTELENLVNSREVRMEKIWHSFQAVLRHHWNLTEDRRRQYLTLRDADLENCKQIFQYYQQINAVNEIIATLKEQLARANSRNDDRFIECKADKENCNELFYVLRRKLVVEKEVDRRKLNFMTDAAENTTKDLTKSLSKGEQILQLMSLCRKLETLNEKICPGGLDKSQLSGDQESEIQQAFAQFQEPLAEEVFKKFSKLDGFWVRYNRAFLEKEALALHHQSLLNEQKQLKNVLKNYLSDYVVAQTSIKAPLMVHRPSSSQVMRRRTSSILTEPKLESKSGPIVTCIEGNQSPSIKHIMYLQARKSC